MQKVVGDLELVGGHIINLRPQKLATDPEVQGLDSALLWFNTTDKVLKYWDGTSIIVLASAAQLGDLVTSSVKVYEYVAATAAKSHSIKHNFGKRWVQVTVFNELGQEIMGDVTAVDANTLNVEFLLPIQCTVVVHGKA